MRKMTLDEVVKKAVQLSFYDRLRLVDQVIQADEMRSVISHDFTEGSQPGNRWGKFEVAQQETAVAILLDGRNVVQVLFHPENLRESRLQLKRDALTDPSEQVKQEMPSALSVNYDEGDANPDLEFDAEFDLEFVDAETDAVSDEIIDLLPKLSWMLCHAALELGTMAWLLEFFRTDEDLDEVSFDEIKEIGAQWYRDFRVRITAKDIEAVFAPFIEQMKAYLGVTRGGARERKKGFRWDYNTTLTFYHAVKSLPFIAGKPMWEYARMQMEENDFDAETLAWLLKRPAFIGVPEYLLREAAKKWKPYQTKWKSLPAENSPQAYAFRHACSKLGIPNHYAYNTLRGKYHEGKKLSTHSTTDLTDDDVPF